VNNYRTHYRILQDALEGNYRRMVDVWKSLSDEDQKILTPPVDFCASLMSLGGFGDGGSQFTGGGVAEDPVRDHDKDVDLRPPVL